MKPVSIWVASAQQELFDAEPILIGTEQLELTAKLTSDSLWLIYHWKDKCQLAFRTAFSPSGKLEITLQKQTKEGFLFELECATIIYKVKIVPTAQEAESFSYLVEATPKMDLNMPFWPRDILPLNKTGGIKQRGTIHTHQVGTRSGILFFDDGESGSVFYLQNLTALNPYCQDTESSAGELVGGEWPEIGYRLPESKKPLKKDTTYTLSHAFVNFREQLPKSPAEIATQYLDRLAETYLVMPRPERFYYNWLDTVEKGLSDLLYHKGCWTFAGGHSYLNAYVADYKTPPEVMVQLAVLLPMMEYLEWKGEKDNKLVNELISGLEGFYKKDTGTIVRWLPAAEQNLDHSEEQKKPSVMDSWYLHHPLMNLARLAQQGEKIAKDLLMKSVDYVVNVARTFKYQWPVFYQMDTLNVIKAETQPGEGGEKDVPGTYADLMLRLYKLTDEKKYLDEAIASAEHLKGMTFDIFYQANNTAFSAGAMVRMYKQTKDKQYLELSYVLLAAIFNNVQLWECDYGHAKNYSTFFAVFPLKDAPYTAAYEEQEVYAALHDYLKEVEGIDILPSIRLLIAEFIRHLVGRVAYYYPPMLPKEMIVEKPKTGETDLSLWIALEDIHDGWEPSGEVGQEVYGAGIAFGVIPRQYYKVPNESFILFCDYPVSKIEFKEQALQLQINGDERLECRVILLRQEEIDNYSFKVKSSQSTQELRPIKQTKESEEFTISGGQQLRISWTKANSKSASRKPRKVKQK